MTAKPTAPAALTWRGVTARRMARHALAGAGPELTVDELTAAQRRELGGEAGLVATVMEATATLTVGTVTTGPHA